MTDLLPEIEALASEASLGPMLARSGLPVDDLVVLGVEAADEAAAANADVWRISLAGESIPPSLIVKRAGANVDPFRRGWAAEAWLYTADVLVSVQCWPRCFQVHLADNGRRGVLILEDGAPRRPGDHLNGLSPAQLERAVATIARVHAFSRGRREILDAVKFEEPSPQVAVADFFTPAWARFHGRWATQLEEQVGSRLLATRSRRAGGTEPTLVHGDFRADNLLFGEEDVLVIDWGDLHVGNGLSDLAWLIVTSADERDIDAVLTVYADAADLPFEDARASFFAALPAALVQGVLMSDHLGARDPKQRRVAEAVAARVIALIPLVSGTEADG